MRSQIFLFALLPAAMSLTAADFWTVRQPSQWSESEFRRMVSDSPWAKDVALTVRGQSDLTFKTTDPDLSDAMRGRTSIPANDAARGAARPGASAAVPHVLVRWDSAAPVLEACNLAELDKPVFTCTSKLFYLSNLTEKFDALAKQFYIVSVSNYPAELASTKTDEAPQHSAAGNAALERLGQRIQESAVIERKNKPPLKPARVLVFPAGRALLLMALFPRDNPITLADKEVRFGLDDGAVEL